jgi:excisionase family DNA binding protein
MADNLPEIMTITEAAQYLRISLSSLYKLAQDGKIPAQKVGKHWRFHRQTLIDWIAAGNLQVRKPYSNGVDSL